jgi:hypothetical protein
MRKSVSLPTYESRLGSFCISLSPSSLHWDAPHPLFSVPNARPPP